MFRFTLLLALVLVACSAPLHTPVQSAHDDWVELAIEIGNVGYIDAPEGTVVHCAPGRDGAIPESCAVRIRESLELTFSYDRSDDVSGTLAALKGAQHSPIIAEGSFDRGFWVVSSARGVHHLVSRSIEGFIKCEGQTTDSAQLPSLIRVCSSYNWQSVH